MYDMPHISISVRDPDEVITTTVHKMGRLMALGMVLSFITRIVELSKTSTCDRIHNCKSS